MEMEWNGGIITHRQSRAGDSQEHDQDISRKQIKADPLL
jgi:hypothetical protein